MFIFNSVLPQHYRLTTIKKRLHPYSWVWKPAKRESPSKSSLHSYYIPGVKARPARKTDNLTAICKPIV
jgi:hypothetical protein